MFSLQIPIRNFICFHNCQLILLQLSIVFCYFVPLFPKRTLISMYFKSLQSLRGLFALLIFFSHFHYSNKIGSPFPAGGDAGVVFFFILSGFVMSLGYMDKLHKIWYNRNFPKFIWNRLSKIFPLHILCLLFSVKIFYATDLFPDLTSLLLLQAWIPYPNWYFSGNGVSWCLSDFLFFYIAVPFIFKLYTNHKRNFILVFLLITFIYASIIIPLIPRNFVNAIVYICPLTRILDFVLGILLWECYNLIRNKYVPIQRYKTILCGMSVLALFTVTVFCYNQFPSTYSLSILWWPSVCAIILYSVVCCPRLLGFRLSVKFGNLSFSFYLLHVLVIYACDMALKKIGLSLMPFPRLIFILTAAVMASTVAHYWFVLPVERYIRNRIKAIQDKNISNL